MIDIKSLPTVEIQIGTMADGTPIATTVHSLFGGTK